jgi:hypothetical protein
MSPNVRSVQKLAVRPLGPLIMLPLCASRPPRRVGERIRSNITNFVVYHSCLAAASQAFQPARSLPFNSGSQPSSST